MILYNDLLGNKLDLLSDETREYKGMKSGLIGWREGLNLLCIY